MTSPSAQGSGSVPGRATGAAGEPSPSRSLPLSVRLLGAAALVGLVTAAVSLRVVLAGEEEIAASTAALRAGDAREAIVRARRAAGWYAPGAPHVRVAYVRLATIASAAERMGDRELALLAWRAVRTASIETRWLVTPHEAELAQANEAIARLAATTAASPAARTEPTARLEQRQLEALLRDEAPAAPWVAVLVSGFAAWVAGCTLGVRRGMGATGHVSLRRLAPGLALAAAGLGAWLLALYRA